MKSLRWKTFLSCVALMGIYVLVVGLFINTPLRDSLGPGLSFTLGSLLATAVALPVGWFISRRLLKPLKEITHASEGFSRGDFSGRIKIYSQDELGQLSLGLNQMAQGMEQTTAATAKDKNQLEALLSSMTEGVVAVDSQERIFKINDAAVQMLRLPREKALDRYLWEVLRNPRLISLIREVLKEGERRGMELTDFLPGSTTALSLHISPIRESAQVSGAAIVLHDVTDLKKLEKMRVEFVANVSHELKTPLTTIKGFVETLKDGALEDKAQAKKFLGIIEAHTQRLENLVNNAIKFTMPGGLITVSASEDNGFICVNFEDTGVGIDEAHLSRIFERFYRVDKGRSRDLGGTGLGLSIVKHIVQIHHGRVAVESTPDK